MMKLRERDRGNAGRKTTTAKSILAPSDFTEGEPNTDTGTGKADSYPVGEIDSDELALAIRRGDHWTMVLI
jgi:hypothetical protein